MYDVGVSAYRNLSIALALVFLAGWKLGRAFAGQTLTKSDASSISRPVDCVDETAQGALPETWIEVYFAEIQYYLNHYLKRFSPGFYGSNLVGSWLFASFPLLFGLILAEQIEFTRVYIRSLPVWVGTFGIAMSMFALLTAIQLYSTQMEEVASVFLSGPEPFDVFQDKWHRTFASSRGIVSLSLVLTVFALTATYAGQFYPDILGGFVRGSLQPVSFPSEWFMDDPVEHSWIIGTYGFFCSMPLAAGVWIVINQVQFYWQLSKYKPVPIPGVVSAKSRNLVTSYLGLAFTGTLGVGLFAALWIEEIDGLSASIIVFFAVLTAFIFFVPQFVFHRHIYRAWQDSITIVSVVYNRQLAAFTPERISEAMESPSFEHDLQSFQQVTDLTRIPPLWIYDLRQIWLLLVGPAIALGVTALIKRLSS